MKHLNKKSVRVYMFVIFETPQQLGTLMVLDAVAIPEMKNVQNLSLNWKKTSTMVWNCLVDVLRKMFQ